MFIIPALVISVFDVIVGTIQAVIAFIKLWILLWVTQKIYSSKFEIWIFRAIFILIIAGITAYYALGLKTVYDDISSASPAAEEPSADTKPQVVNSV